MEPSEPPLREKLKQLRSLLASRDPSAFSEEDLRAAVRLVESFPIEVAESRASEKQLEFQRAFQNRRDESGRKVDIFVAMGANRSGKSIVTGWLCLAWYIRYRAVAGDVFWCISQNLDRSVGGQQRELWHALPRWMFGDQKWDEKIGFGQHRKVVLPTSDGGRCTVEFRSADQDLSTFEQAKLRGVWIDERIPEALYDRLLPRIVDLDGFILYSDIPEQWWHVSRLRDAPPEAGVYWRKFTMFDNAHNLAEGAIETLRGRITSDEASMRIDGEFLISEGIVYKEFVDSRHIIDPFPVPAHWPRWRAIDYGSSAPTACAWFAMAPNGCIYIYREYYDRGHNVQYNAARIIAASGDEVYRKTFMDPHAVDNPPAIYGMAPTVAQQYAMAGIPSTGWPYVNVMGEEAMVQKVKFALENDRLKVFRTCTNVIREFHSWTYKLDKYGKPVPNGGYADGNNHLLDCIKGFIATNPTYSGGEKIEAYIGGDDE